VAVGGSTEKKNPAEMRIAESGTPIRTNQTSGMGSTAASASIWQMSESHDHTCVGVPCAEEILPQRIFHVPAALAHQRSQQKIPTILNRRHGDEDDPGHQSGFASHSFSFLRGG
jgi:hypothetical protein